MLLAFKLPGELLLRRELARLCVLLGVCFGGVGGELPTCVCSCAWLVGVTEEASLYNSFLRAAVRDARVCPDVSIVTSMKRKYARHEGTAANEYREMPF